MIMSNKKEGVKQMNSLKNVETVERERERERERATLYSTWKMSTRPHTSNILKEIKVNNVNRINKKQIELSSICVFLI